MLLELAVGEAEAAMQRLWRDGVHAAGSASAGIRDSRVGVRPSQQPGQQHAAVGRAEQRVDGVLGVRHQAGDVARRRW